MPTTDTFIIPPMQQVEEEKKDKKAKKKSGSRSMILLIGLVLLIISLPVAIYFITQQQQLADTRSRASNQCSAGQTMCEKDGSGNNNGTFCDCKSVSIIDPVTKKRTGEEKVWSCRIDTGSCPKGGSGQAPAPVAKNATGSFAGCGYIEKPPLSGLKPCDSSTCGGDCGIFTYDCGQWCFDKACGGSGCQAIAAKDAADAAAATPTEAYHNDIGTTPNPTDKVPTATPTPAPTSAPNSSLCDASCSTDSNCASGLTCSSVNGVNRCRNASCAAESTCNCPSATNTPEPTTASTNDVATTTTNDSTTGQAMPTSGVGPGVIGSLTVIGSVLLLIAGLAL